MTIEDIADNYVKGSITIVRDQLLEGRKTEVASRVLAVYLYLMEHKGSAEANFFSNFVQSF